MWLLPILWSDDSFFRFRSPHRTCTRRFFGWGPYHGVFRDLLDRVFEFRVKSACAADMDEQDPPMQSSCCGCLSLKGNRAAARRAALTQARPVSLHSAPHSTSHTTAEPVSNQLQMTGATRGNMRQLNIDHSNQISHNNQSNTKGLPYDECSHVPSVPDSTGLTNIRSLPPWGLNGHASSSASSHALEQWDVAHFAQGRLSGRCSMQIVQALIPPL